MEHIKRISELLDSWNNLFVQNPNVGVASGESSSANRLGLSIGSQLTFNPLDRKQYLDRLSIVHLAHFHCRVLFRFYLVRKARRTKSD